MTHAKRFLLKFFLFISLNVLAWGAWLLWTGVSHKITIASLDGNSIYDSHIFMIPEHKEFDLVLMGASRAGRFSASKSKKAVERILETDFFSLAKSGAGILPEKVYLAYFFDKGNRAKQIVYFLDPSFFFSPASNEEFVFDEEPFQASVLASLISNRFDRKVIEGYLKSGLDPRLSPKPHPADNCVDGNLVSPKPELINLAISAYYGEGFSQANFPAYASALAETIRMAQSHNTQITFILPPTLWGNEDPGKKPIINLLSEYKEKHGIRFYDLSDSITDAQWFEDTSHLNCAGVEYFTKHFLKPILQQKADDVVRGQQS